MANTSIQSVYDFKATDVKGREVSLDTYRGKVSLVVNVASKCGLTPQYDGLQALYTEFREQGFEVLAFPSNDFMGQEPGNEAEIATFCSTNYGVTFPLFAKVKVKGDAKHPLYAFLTTEAPHHSEIKWNFHKFLVDRGGRVLANVDPKTEPAALRSQIAEALATR